MTEKLPRIDTFRGVMLGNDSPAGSPPAGTLLPAGLLLDLDGTLVETEHLWQEAQKQIVEAMGGAWSDKLNEELVGTELIWSVQRMITHAGAQLDPYLVGKEIVARMIALVRGGTATVRPGALRLLQLARQLEISTAVVTSSHQELAKASIALLGGHPFNAVVTGDQVARGKPDPEPYLEAARLLGVGIERCLAFEDSPAGLRSALASGAVTIAVPNHASVPRLPGVQVLDSLELVDEPWLILTAAGNHRV